MAESPGGSPIWRQTGEVRPPGISHPPISVLLAPFPYGPDNSIKPDLVASRSRRPLDDVSYRRCATIRNVWSDAALSPYRTLRLLRMSLRVEDQWIPRDRAYL